MTNAHICGEDNILMALLEDQQKMKILLVKKVYPKQDLCVLTPLEGIPALNLTKTCYKGDLVTVEGFPKGKRTFTKGSIGNYTRGITKLADGEPYKYLGSVLIIYQGKVTFGNSGSPVLNEADEVVGVISLVDASKGEWGQMVPLEYIKDFLDSLP